MINAATNSPFETVNENLLAGISTKSPQQGTNILDLLLEIKGKQDTTEINFATVMDDKMEDLKSSLCVEMSKIKGKIETNTAMIDDITLAQGDVDCKIEKLESQTQLLENCLSKQNHVNMKNENVIVTLEDRTNDIEDELMKQRRNLDQKNNSLTELVTTVEHDLASHIQTIKLNVEGEISIAKQNQLHIENRLTDFTVEIESQNLEMKNKIQELKIDYENLKTLNERVYNAATAATPPPNDQAGSCSGNSFVNSCDVDEPENLLYMFGDTTRTLILDGLEETPRENLAEIIILCMNDIGVPLTWDDIEDVTRIGRLNKDRKWPRPVKLTLKDHSIRDQIFYFKSRLRFSSNFKNIRVNKEERKDYRIRTAKLRQAGLSARSQGHKVLLKQGQLTIDGNEYTTCTIDSIPQKFMNEANSVRTPPLNKRILTIHEKRRTNSGRVIMVGPSLQKTPYGLAFYSSDCFLSNFYKCNLTFREISYTCLEQAYQCTKALLNDRSAFDEIYEATSQAEMKRLGKLIQTNDNWEKHKLQIMEDLLYCKFEQNKQLYYSLLNTRPMLLIEATLDNFWGAGCKFGSIALEEGCWEGQNHLGRLLIRIRDYFVRRLEIGQKAIL